MPTDKTILNPKTGRTIIVGGPTYAVLVREGEIKCKDRAFRKPKEPKAPKEPRKKKEAKAPSSSGRKAVKKEKPKKEEPKKEEPKKEDRKEAEDKKEAEAKAAFKAPFKAEGTWRMFVRDAVRFLDYIPNKLGRSELSKDEYEQDIVTAEFQTFYESPGYTYGVRWKLDEGKHLFSNGKGTGYTRVNTSSAFALASYGWEGSDEDSDY